MTSITEKEIETIKDNLFYYVIKFKKFYDDILDIFEFLDESTRNRLLATVNLVLYGIIFYLLHKVTATECYCHLKVERIIAYMSLSMGLVISAGLIITGYMTPFLYIIYGFIISMVMLYLVNFTTKHAESKKSCKCHTPYKGHYIILYILLSIMIAIQVILLIIYLNNMFYDYLYNNIK